MKKIFKIVVEVETIEFGKRVAFSTFVDEEPIESFMSGLVKGVEDGFSHFTVISVTHRTECLSKKGAQVAVLEHLPMLMVSPICQEKYLLN